MDDVASRVSSIFRIEGRSPALKIVLFISSLLVISLLSRLILMHYYESNWNTVANERVADDLQSAIQAFSSMQRETRRIAVEIAQNPTVNDFLSSSQGNRDKLFELLSQMSQEQQVGIEVYDRKGRLVAWEGSSEPSHQREVQIALAGQLASFVTRSLVFSQLFVVTPVRSGGRILGAAIVRRTTELNYPLNNRLTGNIGLAERVSNDIGVQVHYTFSTNASATKDGRFVSAPLIGIDSSKVGIVSVARPSRGAYLESVNNSFHAADSFLWTALIAVFCILVLRRLPEIDSVLQRSLAVAGLIWVVRYLLVWLDVPSSMIHIDVFDPRYFASKFGGGLAKSSGDLFLTSLAMFINIIVVGRYMMGDGRRTIRWWYPEKAFVRWALLPILSALVFLLLRGYAAAIKSAVFDSTLRYNNPVVIVPSFELGVMVVSLFLLSFCLIAAVVALTSFAFLLVGGRSGKQTSSSLSMVAVFFGSTAVILGLLPSDPLVPLFYRLLFGALVLAFTAYLHLQNSRGRAIAGTGNLLLAFGIAAMFFYPVLNDNVNEKDRDRLEVYARNLVKPADSWLRFILGEALDQFASEETVHTLLTGDIDDIDRLAFDHWARSTAAREGYSCIFAVRDTSGYETSRFVIGGQAIMDMYQSLPGDQPRVKSIAVTESGSGVNTVRVYSGSIPIKDEDGRLVAHAYVVIAASQQTLFRGDAPTVLRSETQEPVSSSYRPVTVSDFRNNRLLSSSSALFPVGYTLPESVRVQFSNPATHSLWSRQTIDGDGYETYYIRRSSSPDEIVSLSVPDLGLIWHLIGIIKVVVYYAIVVVVLVASVFVLQWMHGYRYRFTFRDKLLGALLITAVLPLIVMGTYGRQLARDRLLDSTTKRLEQETATLSVSISQRLQGEEGIVQDALNRYEIDQLADEAGADFNLYVGDQLQASSRPELYEVGLLDKRLSGLAYDNTILKGKRFFAQTETIGSYQYAVGYRSIVAGNDRIVAIVAVPTLYRLEEIEEEVSRRNALIFSLYAVILILIGIIATTFANRIAAPIHKLTSATKRVAMGDLNVTVGAAGADGEIGELIRSFEMMTKELAHSRDELVRAERELAWKEMAKQVAHEIKNPLTPMKLSIQHLRQTYKDKVANFDQVFDEVSRTIIEQIEALSRIAGEFARFARMPKTSFEPLNVNAVLNEAVSLFQQDEKVGFNMSLQDELPVVRADKEELRRSFINIIRNGVQAMDNSGTMSIRSWSEQGRVAIAFRDQGTGMTDEVKAKLFQPNFSTKTDGMGLGLAITKKTIDDAGGTITVESVVGEGTTLTIVLPEASTHLQ